MEVEHLREGQDHVVVEFGGDGGVIAGMFLGIDEGGLRLWVTHESSKMVLGEEKVKEIFDRVGSMGRVRLFLMSWGTAGLGTLGLSREEKELLVGSGLIDLFTDEAGGVGLMELASPVYTLIPHGDWGKVQKTEDIGAGIEIEQALEKFRKELDEGEVN